MKQFSKTVAVAALATVASASLGLAQNAPPGAIYNLATSHPAELSTYEEFNVSFVAALANTTISFAFRESPAFFGFDDASVTTLGGPNLLADPGFETATDGTVVPDGWSRWIQPVDQSFVGQVSSNTNPFGCTNYGPHSGSEFWCDGSVEGFDALYQTIATTIGQTYTIDWFMSDNSGGPPFDSDGNTVDMDVYATDGIPQGTIDVPPTTATPEPATLTLLGTGFAGVVGIARRRRNRAK